MVSGLVCVVCFAGMLILECVSNQYVLICHRKLIWLGGAVLFPYYAFTRLKRYRMENRLCLLIQGILAAAGFVISILLFCLGFFHTGVFR